ncbi:MAG: HRDC domain-containing protein [Pirellulales bacterium]|nr:HRDC domain-containing protein [Pirellulales bacterium]
MQFKIIAISAIGDLDAEEELNRFLRSHRVISAKKELVQTSTTSYWCFCIEYIDGPPSGREKESSRRRVDYKEVLSESDFAVFVQLREVRKQLATDEAIPVYVVCTNEQLAEMARNRSESISNLKKINGFGEAKAEKYGSAFLKAIQESSKRQGDQQDAESGKSD